MSGQHWWETDPQIENLRGKVNKEVMIKFNADLLPTIERYGSEIGAAAMQHQLYLDGETETPYEKRAEIAHKLVMRYRVFASLASEECADLDNLNRLQNGLKAYMECRQ